MRTFGKLISIALCSAFLAGCAGASGSSVGTGVGAAGGALAGYAISNDPVGAAIGAGAGALIGREVGRRHDEQRYRDSYYYDHHEHY